jgi:hypothetical protein
MIKAAAMNIKYLLGKISKRYRKRYWLRNDGRWLWGINKFIEDKL